MSSGNRRCGFLLALAGRGAVAAALWTMFAVIASAGTPDILTMRLIEPLPLSMEPLYYRISVACPEALRDGASPRLKLWPHTQPAFSM